MAFAPLVSTRSKRSAREAGPDRVNYQDGTRSFFVDETSTTVSPDLDIPHRTLVTSGREYYWTNVVNLSDVLVRYAGQPATYGVTLSWRH